jgi:5-methylcytosine-specific restriction endonuclease McrA
MLEASELSLSSISLVAGILSDQNYQAILARIKNAPCRKVERIACEFRPPIALRDETHPVRTPGARSEQDLYKFVGDSSFRKLFEETRALLSRTGRVPLMAEVFGTSMKEYCDRHSPIARHERRERKNGATSPDSRRREWKDATKSRHIPDDVRDDVFVRDRRQCAYVAKDGTQCESRHGLQVDHVRPFAAGGTHDPSNLRLLCAAHNRRTAELILGSYVMQRFHRPA